LLGRFRRLHRNGAILGRRLGVRRHRKNRNQTDQWKDDPGSAHSRKPLSSNPFAIAGRPALISRYQRPLGGHVVTTRTVLLTGKTRLVLLQISKIATNLRQVYGLMVGESPLPGGLIAPAR
jgi:hypothetical protein